jgi:hypothetical protein
MFVGQATEDRTYENNANICRFGNFYFRNGFRPRGNRIFVRVGFWKLPPARGLLPAPWPLTRPTLC